MIMNPILRIEYTMPEGEKNERCITISDRHIVVDGIEFHMDYDNGVCTPWFVSADSVRLHSICLEYSHPEDYVKKNPDYYNDLLWTNEQTQTGKLRDVDDVCSSNLILTKLPEEENAWGFGFVTAHRFYAWILLDKKGYTLTYNMEDKTVVPGEVYRLEKFAVCKEKTEIFLEWYAAAIGRENHVRPTEYLPTGFCSWSCYYGDVNEQKILNAAEQMHRFAPDKANLIQIDDGWQNHGSFCGSWNHHPKRFPHGMAHVADKVHSYGMKFGLWLAPMLLDKKSGDFEELHHMARLDYEHMTEIYAFDMDNPEFYDHLHKIFRRMVEENHCDYFKLDFIYGAIGKSGLPKKNLFVYESDYGMALFRKAMQTIRDAVGEDVMLLSCGSPMIATAGIFNFERISCDIIWGKRYDMPDYWTVMQSVVATTFHRYYYNKTGMINDPDGLVVRDYENGDGFNCTYSEAKLWATAVALSGGSVLLNEEIENLSPARRDLYLRQFPPLGVTGRPVDYFEEKPSAVMAEYDASTCFVALFNYADGYRDMTLALSRIGFDNAMVFDCDSGEYVGETDILSATVMNPHSSALFLVKRIPTEPTFLYSTGNLFLGQNLHKSSFVENKLDISGEKVPGESVFAYYPAGASVPARGSRVKTEHGYIVQVPE